MCILVFTNYAVSIKLADFDRTSFKIYKLKCIFLRVIMHFSDYALHLSNRIYKKKSLTHRKCVYAFGVHASNLKQKYKKNAHICVNVR